MSDTEGPPQGGEDQAGADAHEQAGPHEPVGSVGEEAAKLIGALSDWAKDQGTDYAGTAAGAATSFARAVHDVNEHIATGSEDCRYCPVCQVIHVARQTSPEVRAHLSVAASSLMHAAAGMLATQTKGPSPSSPVEKINLDDSTDWDEDQWSYTVGVDVGGTKIAAGLVDEKGTVLARERTESPAKDPAEIVRTIGELVRKLAGSDPVEAVGVSAAGFVDKARSMVVFAPNLAWRDEPLKRFLEEELDLPVVVENDANAAAWGEFTFGAGADVEDLLMLTVGTGVGGGVVIDGELVRGGFGMGAEVGHITMVPGGVTCGCGNLGCLESYGSGTALVRVSRELAGAAPEPASGLVDRAGGDPTRITGPLVTQAAREGDPFAIARLAELGNWLGQGVATLAAVLDPNVVVIGGGVGEAGDLLLDPIRESFEKHVTGRGHRPMLEIRQALLGNAGGMIGVADLARRR